MSRSFLSHFCVCGFVVVLLHIYEVHHVTEYVYFVLCGSSWLQKT